MKLMGLWNSKTTGMYTHHMSKISSKDQKTKP